MYTPLPTVPGFAARHTTNYPLCAWYVLMYASPAQCKAAALAHAALSAGAIATTPTGYRY